MPLFLLTGSALLPQAHGSRCQLFPAAPETPPARQDSQAARAVISLGKFASSAYQILLSLKALNFAMAEHGKAQEELRLSNAKLESLIETRTGALRRLTISLLQSQDEERRGFARNLHDSIGQHLASLKINLERVNGFGDPSLRPEPRSECLQSVDECLKETRTTSYLLHPRLLDEAGFESAARWYVDGFAQRGEIEAKWNFPENMERLSGSRRTGTFPSLVRKPLQCASPIKVCATALALARGPGEQGPQPGPLRGIPAPIAHDRREASVSLAWMSLGLPHRAGLLVNSMGLYWTSFVCSDPSVWTNHGMITCLKMAGSGQTLAWRPR